MCKLGWILNLLLIALLAAMTYMFVIRGNVASADDGRTAILMGKSDRNLVLKEMRGFLESVQEITVSALENDMKTAAEAAARVGRVDLNDLPPSLLRKLPVEVKKLGLATHLAFYNLAGDIRAGKSDGNQTLSRLSDIMNNCVSCHQGYRIDLEK
jgi:hypothetical protein